MQNQRHQSTEGSDAYDTQATRQFHEYFTPMEKTKQVPLSLRFNGHFPGKPGLAGVY